MNQPNARERILQAALKVFSEKSFDGSRIEEISREANIPKSLIYYHFKNKDEILEVLAANFIDEYVGLISAGTNESHQEKADKLSDRMKNVYYEFGQRNADLVRVILMDSLKKTKEQAILYKVVEAMVAKESEQNTDEDYNIQERRIAEFFTSFIPNCLYICFAESWTKYFDITRTDFDNLFLKVYNETHGAYHKNHK